MTERIIIGTVVGVTNPREFYFSITPNKVNVQDLVLVDIFQTDEHGNKIKDDQQKEILLKVWAKVVDLERINPLFPEEAGHELAFSQMSAFDTVISLSREMITAKCRVLGVQNTNGDIGTLTYPLQPASSVYLPKPDEVSAFISGGQEEHRKLNIGSLRSRPSQAVTIDAHAIVARHLAVLATTGAGKTVTVRRILEELKSKKYPMLIFDKHGDYIGLKNLFNSDVKIFYPQIYLNDLNNQSIVQIVSDLSGEEVTPAQEPLLQLLLSIYQDHEDFVNSYIREHTPEKWQHNLNINTHHFFALYQLLKTLVDMGDVVPYSEYGLSSPKNLNSSASPLTRKLFKCANKYKSMKKSAQYIASKRTIITEPLPRNADLRTLIAINNIAIINFEGFDEKIVQSVTANILNQLTKLRISGWQDGSDTKRIPKFLTVIEEAHNYIPSSSEGEIAPCTPIVKQIATEGRKYGMGLVIISQRPSRLDPTILSACNSFVIMKITNPSDQKYIRDIIESIGEDEVKLLPDLTKGEALLTGQFVRFPILVKVAKGDAVGTYEEDDFLLNIES